MINFYKLLNEYINETENLDLILESQDYDETIKNVLGDDMWVSGKYSFPKSSTTLVLNDEDAEKFKNLYTLTLGKQTRGYGELAIYWLFNFQEWRINQKKRILKNPNSMDLMIGNSTLEIKSYPRNSYAVIGKWSSDRYGRRIINNLFSIYNLQNIFKNPQITDNPLFLSEIRFDTKAIELAIESNLELIKAFKTISAKIQEWEKNKRGLNLLTIINNSLQFNERIFRQISESRRPGEWLKLDKENIEEIKKESVADIIYGIVKSKILGADTLMPEKYRETDKLTLGKINKNGYLINVVPKNRQFTGEIDFYRISGISNITDNLIQNFQVSSGEIKIRLQEPRKGSEGILELI